MYVIHGTRKPENLIHILKDGYIDNKPTGVTMLNKDNHPEQVFTQLTFRDMPNEEIQLPFFWSREGGCCVVLKPEILRDLPFYATGLGRFKQRFRDGLGDPESIIASKGRLQRIPDMSALKEHIIKRVSPKPKRPKVGVLPPYMNYTFSHELLFGRRIYLKRYCKCVIIYADLPEKERIQRVCEERGISLKILKQTRGINNFIDLIDS